MVDRVSFFFPIPDTLASSYVLKSKIFLVPPPSISEAVPTLPSDDVIIMLKHIASISEAASRRLLSRKSAMVKYITSDVRSHIPIHSVWVQYIEQNKIKHTGTSRSYQE